MKVKRVINVGSSTVNCGVQACGLMAFPNRGSATRHHISFAGAGTIVTPSTSTTVAGPPSTVTTTSTTIGSSSTTTTTTVPPLINAICVLVRAVSNLLGGFLDGLLVVVGCPPAP